MGHVNNAAYFSYMEEGRVAYFRALFPQHKASDSFTLFPFILAEITATFKSPAHCGDILRVALGITEMKTRSFVMEYAITGGDDLRLIATGRSVLVMFDYQTAQAVPLTPDFRERVGRLEGTYSSGL